MIAAVRRLRRHVVAVCFALLAQNGLAGVVGTVALCCEQPVAAATDTMECCRKGGADHICPTTPRRGDGICRLQPGCRTEDIGLDVTVWVGFVADRVALAPELTFTVVQRGPHADVLPWIQPPPTPPPRA
jgi:hypothetical protein